VAKFTTVNCNIITNFRIICGILSTPMWFSCVQRLHSRWQIRTQALNFYAIRIHVVGQQVSACGAAFPRFYRLAVTVTNVPFVFNARQQFKRVTSSSSGMGKLFCGRAK
jgi:hypothetical protein